MLTNPMLGGSVHNKLFLAVMLAAVVIAIYQLFQPDGLGVGYALIAAAIILVASFVWSKRRKPKV